MKVTPTIYVIKAESAYVWDCKDESEFNKKQEPYKDFPFFKLGKFNEDGGMQYLVEDSDRITITKEDLLELTIQNIPFKVVQTVNVDVDITPQLIEMAEKPITLTQKPGGDTYNNKCEVHMPGQALALYNEVMLLEDTCTDELQSSLNSGWRIIAACPQPDQRRPDYILGRFSPELNIDGSARRTA